MPLVEQELPTLPGHLSSPPVFSGVRVTRSLVLYVCFVDRCLSFCTFSFGHCVVCSSSIYGFWLSLWYLQTFLKIICNIVFVVVLENDFFDPGITCSSYSISHEIRVDKGIYRYICSRNITYCVVAKMFMFISTSLMMHGKNISQWPI